MWQRYLERVDPVLKILHAPTVQQDITKLLRDKSYLDLTRHALFFAIYYTSVITMSAEECRDELQESKGEVLRRLEFWRPIYMVSYSEQKISERAGEVP
jgi:hypothetical protein